MTERPHRPRSKSSRHWLLAALAWPIAGWAQQPFDAVYEVRVDGKPRLETRITLSRNGDHWLLSSTTTGTGGLARFLKVSSEERSQLNWTADGLRPIDFSHHSRVAGADERWRAEFDWEDGRLRTETDDGDFEFQLAPDTQDPLSLTLALGRHLAAGSTDFEVEVVDDDSIESHRYRSAESLPLKTDLGCLDVVALERIREHSKRYSSGWYAKTLGFLPVRVQHGKRGGKEFDMRIQRLEMAGQPQMLLADCPG